MACDVLINCLRITGHLIKIENESSDLITNMLVNKIYYNNYCLYTTSRTVLGSISGGVTGFFSDIFPSDRTMALGSTQPLVKMRTRNISWG